MARLYDKYKANVVPNLISALSIKNVHNVPKIEKVVVNVGAGEAVQNPKAIEFIVNDLQLITGQKAVICKAKKSIASFKLRENMPIGVKVTLRGQRMYEFLDRIISIALPRVRDFKGVRSKSFDGKGNYTFAIREQLVFPEIEFDKTDKVRGLGIIIVTNTDSDESGKLLLKELGFFFRD